MKAYKIELLVIDYDDVGEEEILSQIESVNFGIASIHGVKSVDLEKKHQRGQIQSWEYKNIFENE